MVYTAMFLLHFSKGDNFCDFLFASVQQNPHKTRPSHKGKNLLTGVVNVKILKIGTPEIITIIVLQLEQLDFTVQYCVQKMPTE